MTIKTVTVDIAVWTRDTYRIDIPDDFDTENDDLQQFIDDAIDNGRAEQVGETETLQRYLGADRQVEIEGEDVQYSPEP